MQFLLSNRVKAIDELRLFKNPSVARVKLTKQQENLKPRSCVLTRLPLGQNGKVIITEISFTFNLCLNLEPVIKRVQYIFRQRNLIVSVLFLRLLVWFKAWDINSSRHFAFNYYLNSSYRLCGLLTCTRHLTSIFLCHNLICFFTLDDLYL